MSDKSIFTWFSSLSQSRLQKKFIQKKDIPSLNNLLKYIFNHSLDLSLENSVLRNSLFSIASWEVENEYRNLLFLITQKYLFDNVKYTQPQEWIFWIDQHRLQKRFINTADPVTVKMLFLAFQDEKLLGLSAESRDFLLESYRKNHETILFRQDDHHGLNDLPIVMEYLTLINRFENLMNMDALNKLLGYVMDHSLVFPIDKSTVRKILFKISNWKINQAYEDLLFSSIESYLFDENQKPLKHEWEAWIREQKNLNRSIDVINPILSKALLNAQNTGLLSGLSKDNQNFLLNCYLKYYKEILDTTSAEHMKDLLPIFMEFATITNLLDNEELSADILKRWAAHIVAYPRALTTLAFEKTINMPIRGVGSPHGICITFYQNSFTNTPLRYCSAGITGDPVLNLKVFNCLFATALACENEESFITTNGSLLSFDGNQKKGASSSGGSVLSAVIGPAGPIEPTPGIPTLGMDVEESRMIVADTLQKMQDATGLVQTIRWDIEDVKNLEHRIRQTLTLKDNQPHVIKSSLSRTENASLVHLMPLLHRSKDNQVIPMEIEIPYALLGPQKVFTLLSTARQNYMQQLIADGERRKIMAEEAFKHNSRLVKVWFSMTEAQKQKECQAMPFVTITQQYNFELGIIVPLVPPQQIPRKVYEEQQRPQLTNHAKIYAEKFTKLCEKLGKLNRSGGRADNLTFKLLIDAMLRQAPLSIAHTDFQEKYKNWVKFSSLPIWTAIADWAKQRGYSPEVLAADNIVFNAKINGKKKSIIIQPWIMIDPHDFIIRIDCRQGLMYLFAGGRTPTLEESLIVDKENNIGDLMDLHKQFSQWVNQNLHLKEIDTQSEKQNLESQILDDSMIHTVVQLRTAKHLLFKGEVERSLKLLEAIRSKDLAAVYFWGAVARQYEYLKKNALEFHLKLTGLNSKDKADKLINASLNTLIGSLKPMPKPQLDINMTQLKLMLSSQGLDSNLIPKEKLDELLLSMQSKTTIPVDSEAQRYLKQLEAKDPQFLKELTKEKPNILQLESQSLNLTEENEKLINAAISGFSSLELIHLAESMYDTARIIPTFGNSQGELRKTMIELQKKITSLTYRESSVSSQIENLAKML